MPMGKKPGALFCFLLLVILFPSIGWPKKDKGDDLPPTIDAEAVGKDHVKISLKECIGKALDQNPQVFSGQMDLEAAIAARKQSIAGFLPVIQADVSALYYNKKPTYGRMGGATTIDPVVCTGLDETDEQAFCTGLTEAFSGMFDIGSAFEAKQYNISINVQVSQPLTPLYQAYYGYKMADIGVDMAAVEQDRIKADLVMRTIEAYYGYLTAIAALESVNEALALMESHVVKAQSYFEADFMTKNDVLQAKVRLAQLKGQRLQIGNSVILARENLLVLLNEPPGTLLVPTDEADAEIEYLKVKEMTEHEAIDIAMKNRPDLKMMETAVEQNKTAVKMTKGGYIPSVSIVGAYQHQEGPAMEMPEFSVGAVLSWKVWQWGKVYYGVDEAKAKVAAAEAGMESLKRSIELEVKQALLAINLAREEIQIQQEAVESAREQLRMEESLYDAKANTSTEVLDATSRLVEAQVNLATSRYEILVAHARLKKACGL